jgi:hypothetical protein
VDVQGHYAQALHPRFEWKLGFLAEASGVSRFCKRKEFIYDGFQSYLEQTIDKNNLLELGN